MVASRSSHLRSVPLVGILSAFPHHSPLATVEDVLILRSHGLSGD